MTPTPTNTPTSTPTSTGCLTAATNFTPSPTPIEVAAAASGRAPGIVISEIRTCGPNGGSDEYIELYNSSNRTIDISGWEIRISDATGVIKTALAIQTDTLLPRGYHFLAANVNYKGTPPDQTFNLPIPDNGGVALVNTDNGLIDQVGMSAGSAFKFGKPLAPLSVLAAQSYERKAGGDSGNCIDTANNANDFQISSSNPQSRSSAPVFCPPSTDVTFNALGNVSSFFSDHIRKPDDPGIFNLPVLITNLVLAIILALIMAAASTVLNDVLEGNEAELIRGLGPLGSLAGVLGRILNALDARFGKRRLGWVIALLKLVIMLVVSGIVFSFLDPSFDLFSASGWGLILAMGLSVGLVGIIDDIAQFVFLRRTGENATLRVHAANLALAGLSTGVSKFVGLAPGFIFGSPAGIEEVESRKHDYTLHLIAIAATGLAALAAWLVSPLVLSSQWLTTVMLLTFGAGVQTIFFEMLPIRSLHGRSIFETNKIVWAALFVLVTAIFMQTMLNPDGSFLSAFESGNMVTLAVGVGLFCLFTAIVWLYFARRTPQAGESGQENKTE
ncbi:MAG TPA: lamin tail domain-containing protein [Anaerolineae bacterium]